MGIIEDARRAQKEAAEVSKKYQSELKEKTKTEVPKKKNYQGLGGWLILVGLGLVLSAVLQFVEIFNYDTWITTSIEMLSLSLSIYITYLFFSESRNFPKWYIGLLIFGLAINTIVIVGGVINPEDIKEASQLFIRSIVSSMIWIPYMLVSKRVKATFIK